MDSNTILQQLTILLKSSPSLESSKQTPQPVNDNVAPPILTNEVFGMERCLVAWVLLTRLEDDPLQQAWTTFGPQLEHFATNQLLFLLDDKSILQKGHSLEWHLKLRYLRLVAQVTARLEPSHYPSKLGQRLFALWRDHYQPPQQGSSFNISSTLLLSLHIDVCSSIERLLELCDPFLANPGEILECVWTIYSQYDPNNTSPEEISSSKELDGYPSDEIMMIQTLDNILDNNNNSNNNNDDDDIKARADTDQDKSINSPNPLYTIHIWHELMLEIITHVGSEQLLPSTLPLILQWIVNPPATLDRKLLIVWNEWCLGWITTRMQQQQQQQQQSRPAGTSHGTPISTDSNTLSIPPLQHASDPFSQVLLWQDQSTISNLQQLLLAHVISPHGGVAGSGQVQHADHHALRAMSWQTLVALVETNGWDWMIDDKSSRTDSQGDTSVPTTHPISNYNHSKLGAAAMICTWIRLASGEWRIQLQGHMPTTTTNETGGAKNTISSERSALERPSANPAKFPTTIRMGSDLVTGWQATALPIGYGCARLLQNMVQYCIRLADDTLESPQGKQQQQQHITRSAKFSGDALLHLRQSLEQTLWTTVEYLAMSNPIGGQPIQQMQQQQQQQQSCRGDPNDRVSFFHVALRLLGTLLMEMDIFDLLEKNHSPILADMEGDDSISTDEKESSSATVMLQCLRSVLPVAEDPCLLPGLVHILGSYEGDQQKLTLICEILWEPIGYYLEWCWQRDAMDDTVAWACSCTELWVNLLESSNPEVALSHCSDPTLTPLLFQRKVCLAILSWMQQVLRLSDPSTRNTLSLALGCYMTLSKDRASPPKEHESRIILRALQWIGMS